MHRLRDHPGASKRGERGREGTRAHRYDAAEDWQIMAPVEA